MTDNDYATDSEIAREQGWDDPDPETEARYTLEDEARERFAGETGTFDDEVAADPENRRGPAMTLEACVASGQHGLLIAAGVFHEHEPAHPYDEQPQR